MIDAHWMVHAAWFFAGFFVAALVLAVGEALVLIEMIRRRQLADAPARASEPQGAPLLRVVR